MLVENNKPNPFEVLKLPTDATKKEIIERAREMSSISEQDEQLLYRWAKEQLITHPFTRLAYELFELPDTEYEEDLAWETFSQKYRHNPLKRASILDEEVPPLELADFKLTVLLQYILDGLLDVPEENNVAAELKSPFQLDSGVLPLELQDVIFG